MKRSGVQLLVACGLFASPNAICAPPASVGQCVITAVGSSYDTREVQRWEIDPARAAGMPGPRTFHWTTTGGGSSTGPNAKTTWTFSATEVGAINVQRLPNGTWLAQPPQSPGKSAISVTTRPLSGRTTTAVGNWPSFGYPALKAPPSATRIDETKSFPISAGNAYARPAATTGSIVCEWHLAL